MFQKTSEILDLFWRVYEANISLKWVNEIIKIYHQINQVGFIMSFFVE